MGLSVPTTFQNEFLDDIEAINARPDVLLPVVELYGSFQLSPVGSGRASYMLPPVSIEEFRGHVSEVRKRNLQFNYAMNAACLGNKDFTREGIRAIVRLVKTLDDFGVDWITVVSPFLVEIIREVAPRLRVNVSVIATVDSRLKAGQLKRLGAHRITYCPSVNRDFDLLRDLVSDSDLEHELLLNTTCLFRCPFNNSHFSAMAHESSSGMIQGRRRSSSPSFSYSNYCMKLKLADQGFELVRSPWIPPSGIRRYSELGIDVFKVGNRGYSRETILKATCAYGTGEFSGNLLDILIATSGKIWDGEKTIRVEIDSGEFAPFFDRIVDHADCRDCGKCGLCARAARKAVSIEFVSPDAEGGKPAASGRSGLECRDDTAVPHVAGLLEPFQEKVRRGGFADNGKETCGR